MPMVWGGSVTGKAGLSGPSAVTAHAQGKSSQDAAPLGPTEGQVETMRHRRAEGRNVISSSVLFTSLVAQEHRVFVRLKQRNGETATALEVGCESVGFA